MPSERFSLPKLVKVPIIVAVAPLRFSHRPAGDADEGYESHGENGSG